MSAIFPENIAWIALHCSELNPLSVCRRRRRLPFQSATDAKVPLPTVGLGVRLSCSAMALPCVLSHRLYTFFKGYLVAKCAQCIDTSYFSILTRVDQKGERIKGEEQLNRRLVVHVF
jgi:hypothetical protein